MELLTNDTIIITLNVFAVCLWVITILVMIKRKLLSENLTDNQNEITNKIQFNETLRNKIKKVGCSGALCSLCLCVRYCSFSVDFFLISNKLLLCLTIRR